MLNEGSDAADAATRARVSSKTLFSYSGIKRRLVIEEDRRRERWGGGGGLVEVAGQLCVRHWKRFLKYKRPFFVRVASDEAGG